MSTEEAFTYAVLALGCIGAVFQVWQAKRWEQIEQHIQQERESDR